MKRALLLLALAAVLGACGLSEQPAAQQALPALAELAAPHLQQLAEKHGLELDEARGICIEIPTDEAEDLLPEELPLSVVAVLCVAPELKPPE